MTRPGDVGAVDSVLRMTTGLLITIVFGVLSLIALHRWLTYCTGIARAHPKHAAKIIEASGRWYPRLRIRPPKQREL